MSFYLFGTDLTVSVTLLLDQVDVNEVTLTFLRIRFQCFIRNLNMHPAELVKYKNTTTGSDGGRRLTFAFQWIRNQEAF